MSACPLCGSDETEVFLRRARVPVHQHVVIADVAAARSAARGALRMAACRRCGFVFNEAFDPEKLEYGAAYDNTQAHSGVFDAYMDERAAEVVAAKRGDARIFVEAGCGKGHFLRKVLARAGQNDRAIGFDPSYAGPDSALDGRLAFRRTFYDAAAADVRADVVICRHVIEHLPSPLDLLRALRAALTDSPNAAVFIETPCVAWILENGVVWDFFYEHCSLFSAESFRFACARAGIAVNAVTHTFGGQYLWLAGAVAPPRDVPAPGGAAVLALAHRYAVLCEARERAWSERLQDLKRQGGVAVWGAGAKGVTFANLVDPDRVLIDCLVDINPNKQGHFVPGTGHAIVSPQQLAHSGVKSAILLNPNYRAEVGALLAASHAAIELVDWNDT